MQSILQLFSFDFFQQGACVAFRTFSTVIRLIVIQFFSSPKKHICFTCLVYLLIDRHSPSNEPAKSQKEALWDSIVLRVKDLSLITGLSPLGLYYSSGKILSLITGSTTKSMWGHSIMFHHFDEANARNVGNRYSHDLSSLLIDFYLQPRVLSLSP